VYLAPDLPSIRMALAQSRWLEGGSPAAALRAVGGAVLAIPRHLEASLWFSGTALYILAIALIGAGVVVVVLSAAFALPHAAHDLGDFFSRDTPKFARLALLGAALLVPLALGEGLFGLVVACLAIGVLYGPVRQRWVLAAASLAVILGAFPVARLGGAVLTAYVDNPIVEAAVSATEGFGSPVDILRLKTAPDDDPLAVMALAIDARRRGRLGEADSRYQKLLEIDASEPAVANNAANVRLGLGHADAALNLYQRATQVGSSATVYFNLSQAHGRAFQVDELNRALEAAQQLDEEVVADLTQLQGSDVTGFTVDLPLPRRALWRRILSSTSGAAIAAELRAVIAPGRLGTNWWVATAAFALAVLLAATGSLRLRRSHGCKRCGRRMCPRCDPEFDGGKICEGCTRLHRHPETTDRVLRAARIEALKRRDERIGRAAWIVSILLPGSAGILAQRHWSSLVGALAAALSLTALFYRNGIAPDPLVAGAAAPLVFGAIAVSGIIVYAIVVGVSLASLKRT
jgi:tetratricopeptide (TPR) repeat protein